MTTTATTTAATTSTASEFAASIAAVVRPFSGCTLASPLDHAALAVAQHIDAHTHASAQALTADALEGAFEVALESAGLDALPSALVDLALQHPAQWHVLNAALDRASAQAHAFAAVATGRVNPRLFVHGSTEGRAVVCMQRVLNAMPSNVRASRTSAQARALVAAVLANAPAWRDFVAHLALMSERAA